MNAIPISVQLYTVREEAEKDFVGVLRRIAAMGYVGVEFAGMYGMTPEAVRAVLDAVGLEASSSHGAMPNKENVGDCEDGADAWVHAAYFWFWPGCI